MSKAYASAMVAGDRSWSSREPHTPGQEKNDSALGAPLARSLVGKVAKTVRGGLLDCVTTLTMSSYPLRY
jgi:hypothetical protein